MSAYSSSQAGNWSAQATWGGSGPPGNGDTVTLTHAITVDANTTVGASPFGKPPVAPTVSATTGSAVTFLPTGAYRIAYSFVSAGGESCMSAETGATTFTQASSKPRVTLPALPTGVTSISLYLTAAGGAAGSETRFCTGITGTTIDLIGADDGASGSYWENAQGGDGNDAVGGTVARASAAAPQAVPAAAILLNGTGAVLTVNTGVTLTVRGDIKKAANTARVVLSAGSTLKFDGSAASTPAAAYYASRPDTHSRTGVILDAQGTSGSHCTITSVTTSSAAAGAILSDNLLQGAQVTAVYTDCSYLGSALYPSILPYLSTSGNTLTLDNCTFDSCGEIRNVAGVDGSVVRLQDCSFSSSLGTYPLNILFGAVMTTGTRLINRCVFDKRVNLNGPYSITITNNLFRVGYVVAASGNPSWASFTGNLIRLQVSNDSVGSSGNMSNSFFLFDPTVDDNPHYLLGPTIDAAMTYDGLIFESAGTSTNGDSFSVGNPTSARTITIQNCIKLPNANGGSSGTMISAGGGANITIAANHNTIHLGGAVESSGIRYGETYAGHAGMISSARSNLGWDTSARGYVVYAVSLSSITDIVTAANCDYNGKYNTATGTHNNIGGSADQSADGYENIKITAAPGAHDVTGDPSFVDSTRDIASWGAMKGADGTVAGALALIAANPALIYNAGDATTLIPWIRAGFAPRNPAYRNAGHDGVTIGAVEGVWGNPYYAYAQQ